MSESYDQRAAARTAAGLLAADLNRVSGVLEEVATVWRRAELYGQQPASIAPRSLQNAAGGLADTLRLLPEADSEQHPVLAFSAVTQLAVLESDAARSARVTGDLHLGDAEMWATIQRALAQARNQLWKLISCLARIGDQAPSRGHDGQGGRTSTESGRRGRIRQRAAETGSRHWQSSARRSTRYQKPRCAGYSA